MSNAITVIGATGKIGNELVKLLRAKGGTVRAAARNPGKTAAMFGPGVEVAEFDFVRSETFDAAFAGTDRVFMIVAATEPGASGNLGTLVERIVAAGVRHVVLVTAMNVEMADENQNPLRRAEKLIQGSGMAYTILRPNWFMQNFSVGFILPSIRATGGIFLPAGDAKTGFIDVRDIAAVAAAALTEEGHAGKAYALTGSQALSYGEAAEIISRAAGRGIRYAAISDADMRRSMAAAGSQPEQLEMYSGLFYAVRQGWASPVTPTVADVLGRPPITFEQFAADYAAAWR